MAVGVGFVATTTGVEPGGGAVGLGAGMFEDAGAGAAGDGGGMAAAAASAGSAVPMVSLTVGRLPL